MVTLFRESSPPTLSRRELQGILRTSQNMIDKHLRRAEPVPAWLLRLRDGALLKLQMLDGEEPAARA